MVVGQWRKGHARLPIPYARAITKAGGIPKIFSTFHLVPDEETPEDLEVETGLDPDDASPLDGAVGLLLPGGGDIDPTFYGEKRHPMTKNVSHRRDLFELTLLESALKQDLPVFAICHGMQLLNVALGGTLEQHIPDVPGRVNHDTGSPVPEPVHDVRLKEGSLVCELLEGTTVPVNSSHHQGLGVVSDGLEELGWAEDGVIEAVKSREHEWVLGVQWHPEAMVDHHHEQLNLFECFVGATERFASRAR